MIEYRRKSKNEWLELSSVVTNDDLPILVRIWLENGFHFRINSRVYTEYSDDVEKALIWRRLSHHD